MDGGEAVSSTRVRQAIAAGEMERARQLLGRRYFLDFSRGAWQGTGPQIAVSDY